MRKIWSLVFVCLLLGISLWTYGMVADRQELKNSLIRFHVVANSDEPEDQEVKLMVRDAVIDHVQQDLAEISDVEEAKQYLQSHLTEIECVADFVLVTEGFEERARVTLCQESFGTREYETFSLPSGVYESLRIVIGEGKGQNWWCVTFPSLCLTATTEEFVETASQAGIDERLIESLANDGEYEVRFYFLDAIGKMENCLFRH